jgi:DNA-binding transcriptional LysR family regulator
MKPTALNYHHLRYFWVVAREGSVTRAARRLGVAVQTISAQIAQLEQSLGKVLLAPQGRRLVPTETGRLALAYADQIFQLGERMDAALREADATNSLRLAVGISDALPKLIAFRLMEAVFHLPEQVRLVCREGEFDTLLAELALHRLDVVLTDRQAPHGGNLKVFSHGLGEFDITLFAVPDLARRYRKGFPGNLDGAPMLLPTRGNACADKSSAGWKPSMSRRWSSANSKTAHCSPPSAAPAWACFPHPRCWARTSPPNSAPSPSACWTRCGSSITRYPTSGGSATLRSRRYARRRWHGTVRRPDRPAALPTRFAPGLCGCPR